MARTVEIRGVPHVYELTTPTDKNCVLVFVHGWLLSRRYWQPAIDQLASTYQCLAYDLRGFGDSQLPTRSTAGKIAALEQAIEADAQGSVATAIASEYTPAAYAQDLIDLLRQLHLSNAWLVGHSLGGSISLWAADLAPDLIRGVICVNSGGGIYLKEEFERFRTAGQQLVQMRPRWLGSLPLIDLLMTRLNVARPIARSWGRQRLLDLVNANLEAALGTLLDSTTETEVHCLPQVVSRLTQPVYFIAGAEDTIMEPQYVRHLASFHPLFCDRGENVYEISDCGHLSMVEQPEAVVAQMRSILAAHHGTA
ncbi:alpha/beta hydrolase [Microcoleus sp. FACHB-1515]|uniref:alpha/beta fold hydrolase n=1 Tax=Cyanophyceae TaxID=3028117 RepID=UPI001688058D|nr:alpha/beta hydrolase [Microcoleus sp. FACHB-1515]MBD2090771.1 alpha/beta hydrolase [Microcoleus sp. FACHB-1515]